MNDVNYGGSDIKVSGIGYAILDTGLDHIYLGKSDYEFIKKQLEADFPDDFDCNKFAYCLSEQNFCDVYTRNMSSLMIQLQENYYTLPPEAYTYSTTDKWGSRNCIVAISYEVSSEKYMLGNSFLRNFVTTFDFDKGEIRLAVNKNAPSGVTIEYKMSDWEISLITVGCLAAAAGSACVTVCLCKRHKKKTLKEGD